MKFLTTLFLLLVCFLSLGSANLMPYENFEWKLDIVFEQIDWIIDTNDSIEEHDVFSMLSALLRSKYASWNLSEKHTSIFAYMLAYYDLSNSWSDFPESATDIYHLIEQLDYLTCEMDSDCQIVESENEIPTISPSVNSNAIGIVDKNSLLYLPLMSPRIWFPTNGIEDVGQISKCIESYCATEYVTWKWTNIYKRSSKIFK